MRASAPVLMAALLVVVGAIVGIDLSGPSSATDVPMPVRAGPAVGGAAYCAAGAVGPRDNLAVVTAAPPDANDPADTAITRLDGSRTEIAVQPVFPGAARRTAVGSVTNGNVGVTARWWDWPVVTSRVWRHEGQGDGVTGTVAGPCADVPSSTWYVPGVSTAGGGNASLYIANPFASDASVAISFTTPSGRRDPIRLENVSVSAYSVKSVNLNEFIPREANVGVAVRTRAGRVVVEAVQQLNAAIGGVNARALVRAAPQLAETWTMPWSLSDPTDDGIGRQGSAPAAPTVRTASPGNGTASWIWVSNPGSDPAEVTVTLHTATGPVVAELDGDVLVEGGQVLRIDLRGLLPPGQSAAGATLRSENGVPIVAGMSTLFQPDATGPDQTGYTSQLGVPGPDPSWVVPGEAVADRQQILHVVNPGADPAVVAVAVWNGSVLQRPANLQHVAVAPGALVELDISGVVGGADHTAAFVTASQGTIVAGRHSVGAETAGWIAHVGVPSRVWSGGQTVPSVEHEPTLVEELGTSRGVATATPSDQLPPLVSDEPPTPTPSPLLPSAPDTPQ